MKLIKLPNMVINTAHVAWAEHQGDSLVLHMAVPVVGSANSYPVGGHPAVASTHAQICIRGAEAQQVWDELLAV